MVLPKLDIREAAKVGEALKQVETELTRYRSGLEDWYALGVQRGWDPKLVGAATG